MRDHYALRNASGTGSINNIRQIFRHHHYLLHLGPDLFSYPFHFLYRQHPYPATLYHFGK